MLGILDKFALNILARTVFLLRINGEVMRVRKTRAIALANVKTDPVNG